MEKPRYKINIVGCWVIVPCSGFTGSVKLPFVNLSTLLSLKSLHFLEGTRLACLGKNEKHFSA